MSNRYPFMREFTTVPLELFDAERLDGTRQLLRSAFLLMFTHMSSADRTPLAKRDGQTDVAASLYLHNRTDGELVTVEAILKQDGDPLYAAVGLTALDPETRSVVERHTYSIDDPGPVRDDVRDMLTENADGVAGLKDMAQRIFTDRVRVPPPDWPPDSIWDPGTPLTRDAVHIDEMNGLHTHLVQGVDAGLYVPVSLGEAQAINSPSPLS